MRTIKTRGIEELRALRRRVRRSLAMERISRDDFLYIDARLDEVEARMITMRELDEDGKETG